MSIRIKGKNNPQFGNKHAADHLNLKKEPCPHCKKLLGLGNLKRWHGDNCKFRQLYYTALNKSSYSTNISSAD